MAIDCVSRCQVSLSSLDWLATVCCICVGSVDPHPVIDYKAQGNIMGLIKKRFNRFVNETMSILGVELCLGFFCLPDMCDLKLPCDTVINAIKARTVT